MNQLLNEGIPEKEFDQEIDKEHYRDAGIHEAMQLVDEAILSLNLQNDLHVNILKVKYLVLFWILVNILINVFFLFYY